MKSQNISWKTPEGISIEGIAWIPENEVKGIIVLVHGYGEHAGRYQPVATYYGNQGFVVLAADLQGHGKSGGKRGFIPDTDQFFSIPEYWIACAEKHYPGKPVILYGQSMGGNIVAAFLLKRKPKVAGAVLSSPWFRLAMKPPAWKLWLAKTVIKILPSLQQPADIDVKFLSRDAKVGEAYLKDPLVHDRMTPALFLGLVNQGEWNVVHAGELHTPVLVMHGSDDHLTSHSASSDFCNASKGRAILKLWPGAYHELHFEMNKDEVLAYAAVWMKGL